VSAGASAGGAAAAAAIAQAVKASGAIVRVEPDDFLSILDRHSEPLAVRATGGFFTTRYLYLRSYRDLAFFTKSPSALVLAGKCEMLRRRSLGSRLKCTRVAEKIVSTVIL
jgi:hypothetical protein